MSLPASLASLTRSVLTVRVHCSNPGSFPASIAAFPIARYATSAHDPSPPIRRNNHRRKARIGPYAALFSIPSPLSIRALYRALLVAAARFPDDLVRWYVVQRCRDEWRLHRTQHRERYQADVVARYDRQKARLQVRERLQRIQAGESDETATRAALDLHFEPLELPPPQQVHLTNNVLDIPIDLRRTIDERYWAAKAHLKLLHTALLPSDTPEVLSSRTAVLCAAYGWQGGPVLNRLTHLRHLYLNAPNMLQPATLSALHPLHRYLVTGVRSTHERPSSHRLGASGGGARRPATGAYEGWPAARSDRLVAGGLVGGAGWVECYRLLIAARCQVLEAGWRRAYSDMLRQRQLVGQVGEVEQPGTRLFRGARKSSKQAEDAVRAQAKDEMEDEEGDHKSSKH